MTGRTVQRRPSSHALRVPSTTHSAPPIHSATSPTPLTGTAYPNRLPEPPTRTAYPTVIVTLLLTIFGWSFIDSCAV